MLSCGGCALAAVCSCGSVVRSLCGRQFLHDCTSVGVHCDGLNLFKHVILADAYRALAFFGCVTLSPMRSMYKKVQEVTHWILVFIPFSFALCDVLNEVVCKNNYALIKMISVSTIFIEINYTTIPKTILQFLVVCV